MDMTQPVAREQSWTRSTDVPKLLALAISARLTRVIVRASDRQMAGYDRKVISGRRVPCRYRSTRAAFPTADNVKISPPPSLADSGLPALTHA